jgi:hypothetical protein
VSDGHEALLVAPDDPDAMAAAIGRVLMHPDLGASLSRQARARAARCDWAVVLPQWEQLLTDVGGLRASFGVSTAAGRG